MCLLHCNKTEGEIPVPTPSAAEAQRSTEGKYFLYESGVNTLLFSGGFLTCRNFPVHEKRKAQVEDGIEPMNSGTTFFYSSIEPLSPYFLCEK
jgi:hypothetical protein